MFGSKKSITDRVKDSLTDYLDDKFEDYRGQIALDLARGIGALAGLVALWSVIIIAAMFFSFAFSLFLGWVFSFFMTTFAYALSFLLVSVILIGLAAFIIKHKEKYIVTPVFDLMSATLRTTMGLDEASDETPSSEENIKEPTTGDKTKTPVTVNTPDIDIDLEPHSIKIDVKTETPPTSLKKEEL
jgi:hypothetical protein